MAPYDVTLEINTFNNTAIVSNLSKRLNDGSFINIPFYYIRDAVVCGNEELGYSVSGTVVSNDGDINIFCNLID